MVQAPAPELMLVVHEAALAQLPNAYEQLTVLLDVQLVGAPTNGGVGVDVDVCRQTS
jgi:hypothetical protein